MPGLWSPAWSGFAETPWALLALSALVGLAVDQRWGEPAARWHPVVWMGRVLERLAHWVAPAAGSPQARKVLGPWVRGTVAWCLLASGVVAVAWALESVLLQLPLGFAILGLGIGFKPMMAWRMLHDEVAAVGDALNTSLETGRERLSWLCSRPVDGLGAGEVRETAMETLAENLNDSVVAPVFWFLVAGLPGAALYRMANTADAMWGYRGERQGRQWGCAGKWAARADDVLSWVPARLTALCLGLAAWAVAGRSGCAMAWWPRLRSQARLTPSPNGGWPMATLALALQVRLGKPGAYVLNASGREPTQADLNMALRLARAAVVVLAVALVLLASVAVGPAFARWLAAGGGA